MSDVYEHPVLAPGEIVHMTLAELLAVGAEPVDDTRLARDLESIREAERAAEREGATIRLY